MATRIAVLADAHLSPIDGTAQDAVLDWALCRLRADPPDVVVVAGDMTAAGSYTSARRLREKLDRARLTVRMTPGNSDRRTPEDWARVRHLLSLPSAFVNDECAVIPFDTSGGRIPKRERRRVEDLLAQADPGQARECAAGADQSTADPRRRRVVLVTHIHPEGLRRGSRGWLDTVLNDGRTDLLVVGHRHMDSVDASGRTAVHIVRGLDPDKAIGAPPALALFQWDGSKWLRQDIPFPDGDPIDWPKEERDELAGFLGISCMTDTLGGLAFAATERVAFVELRAPQALELPDNALTSAVASWRRAGGRELSLHMPDVGWDSGGLRPGDVHAWNRSLRLADSLAAGRLTVHVPRIPVGCMQPGTRSWDALVQAHVGLLAPAVERGLCIGIENLHMQPGLETDDGRRGFGYLPEECLSWLDSLRHHTGHDGIGLLLDIGHARNNSPFSRRVTLGQWYTLVGGQAVAYHVHQVVQSPRGMRNHTPFCGLFGPLVSLSSFFWSWRHGHLRHAPVILEVRDPEACYRSFDLLRSHCREARPGGAHRALGS